MKRTLWLLSALVLLFAGCGSRHETISIIAGSEIKDLEPLFDQIEDETGIRFEMHYIGTLDGAELLLSGQGGHYDLAWFSHAKYLTLLQGGRGIISSQEQIMLSPVVMGVKLGLAERWGWVDEQVSWPEIIEKVQTGELRFAMTNPTSSNSGFTSLVGIASALAGTGDALTIDDIERVAPELSLFFDGMVLTAGSSGWLAEAYVREQDRLNALINYESVLLSLNQSGELMEPLYPIYPSDGIITADYPLMLLDDSKREAYETLVDYLLTEEFQRDMMNLTLRRPVNTSVRLSSAIPTGVLNELSFPTTLEVIDHLLFAYLDETRRPSHAIFVLDVSGSMEGSRLFDLQQALLNLTGLDTSITGQFARFRDRERITLITFSEFVQDERSFEIELSDDHSFTEVRIFVNGLSAGGSTSIYGSLMYAYGVAAAAWNDDPERYYSIVLMSDGENTSGPDLYKFLDFYENLPEDLQNIPTFTVLFGEASTHEMSTVAETTGGRLFDATSHSLSSIFKQIRGYQ